MKPMTPFEKVVKRITNSREDLPRAVFYVDNRSGKREFKVMPARGSIFPRLLAAHPYGLMGVYTSTVDPEVLRDDMLCMEAEARI